MRRPPAICNLPLREIFDPDLRLSGFDDIPKRNSSPKFFFQNFAFFRIFYCFLAKNMKNSNNFIFQRIWKIPKAGVRLSQRLQKVTNKHLWETSFSARYFGSKILENRVSLGPSRAPGNWVWPKFPSCLLKARLNGGIHQKKVNFGPNRVQRSKDEFATYSIFHYFQA